MVQNSKITIHLFTFLALTFSLTCNAQDSLIFFNGKRMAIDQLSLLEEGIEVRDMNKEWREFPADSILGIHQVMHEKRVFALPNPDEDDDYRMVFAERLEAGAINLYLDDTQGYSIYLEKDGVLIDLMTDDDKAMYWLKNLMGTDNEALTALGDKKFKLRHAEIQDVVKGYNRRNFKEKTPEVGDPLGKVILYRTRFQKSIEVVKVMVMGKTHQLTVNDYCVLYLPVKFPVKVHAYDGMTKTDIHLAGDLADQYFEVVHDKKQNEFLLDKQETSAIQFEFEKIKEIADGRQLKK